MQFFSKLPRKFQLRWETRNIFRDHVEQNRMCSSFLLLLKSRINSNYNQLKSTIVYGDLITKQANTMAILVVSFRSLVIFTFCHTVLSVFKTAEATWSFQYPPRNVRSDILSKDQKNKWPGI